MKTTWDCRFDFKKVNGTDNNAAGTFCRGIKLDKNVKNILNFEVFPQFDLFKMYAGNINHLFMPMPNKFVV